MEYTYYWQSYVETVSVFHKVDSVLYRRDPITICSQTSFPETCFNAQGPCLQASTPLTTNIGELGNPQLTPYILLHQHLPRTYLPSFRNYYLPHSFVSTNSNEAGQLALHSYQAPHPIRPSKQLSGLVRVTLIVVSSAQYRTGTVKTAQEDTS